ncbi:MAG: S41 family peptidase, partial [Bacilli bacterium]
LILDNFYGLKDYQKVKNYDKLITNIKKSKDSSQFVEELNSQLIGLEDLHTSIVNQGFLKNSVNMPKLYNESAYIKAYQTSFIESKCDINEIIAGTNARIIANESNVLYLEIFKFDGEIRTFVDEAIANNPNVEKIIFDVRCNSGGFLNDINHLLKYTTNEGWSLYFASLYDDKNELVYTSKENKAIAKPFYLVTSPVTFSAANFLASAFKDNQSGTIIGSQSSGGTCAVGLTTLPSGAILSYSSASTCLTNKDYKNVEGGIPVDIKIDFTQSDDVYQSVIEAIK